MKITRDERLHLNKLSKEVMGSSSKWYKVFMNGEKVPTKIKLKSGIEINGYTLVYPTLEQAKASLEERAKEMAAKGKKS